MIVHGFQPTRNMLFYGIPTKISIVWRRPMKCSAEVTRPTVSQGHEGKKGLRGGGDGEAPTTTSRSRRIRRDDKSSSID